MSDSKRQQWIKDKMKEWKVNEQSTEYKFGLHFLDRFPVDSHYFDFVDSDTNIEDRVNFLCLKQDFFAYQLLNSKPGNWQKCCDLVIRCYRDVHVEEKKPEEIKKRKQPEEDKRVAEPIKEPQTKQQESYPVKLHRLVVMVMDIENQSIDEIVSTLVNNNKYIDDARVTSAQSVTLDWTDDHPLNSIHAQDSEFEQLFASS